MWAISCFPLSHQPACEGKRPPEFLEGVNTWCPDLPKEGNVAVLNPTPTRAIPVSGCVNEAICLSITISVTCQEEG
ncbi:Hypothetical predicted protein [Podarcis lilfordi]|uniref:Uncharacterized protein n=1 Tax=Podarcis lilfordi TaxID=74358 RepID=A0AA35JMT5_9SAUR|nr:Hypothetical predicted protein [Podarcis lilfordi]